VRAELRGLSTIKLVRRAARFRPGDQPSEVEAATKFALRSIARRYRQLSEEIEELDGQLSRLVTETAPALVEIPGVGIDTAASLLVAAGEDPKRLKSESAFAHLCGVVGLGLPRVDGHSNIGSDRLSAEGGLGAGDHTTVSPQHPPEFKAEALPLYRSSGRSVSEVARELGISPETLRNWVNQDKIDAGEREGPSTEEREKLRTLRKEAKTLRQEKEILRKAAPTASCHSELCHKCSYIVASVADSRHLNQTRMVEPSNSGMVREKFSP